MTSEKRTASKPITAVMGTAIARSGESQKTRLQRDVEQAEIRSRQRSMMNAMLCYMI